MKKEPLNNQKKPSKTWIENYFSILQFGFSGFPEVASLSVRKIFSAETFWKRILNVIGRFLILPFRGIYSKFKYRNHTNYDKLEGVPWLLITSKNNRDVLRLIKKEIPEAVYFTYEAAVSEEEDIVPLLHFKTWLYTYRFFIVFGHFQRKYGKRVWHHIDYLFKGVGQYEACLSFLKKNRPSYIVFSNDHTIFPRALLIAAKELSIPTIYIQHASITPYFPPLDFDLNLLEGQATLDQYRLNGPVSGVTKFIGMPKFDPYISYRNTSNKVTRIGVCSNKMDKTEVVETFLKDLQEVFPTIKITFRPHPADTTIFKIPKEVKLSTKEELAFEFLQKQDLVIAGNTSIHLEAVLLNLEAVYYEYAPYQSGIGDMYLYCKNNLAKNATNKEVLIKLIEAQMIEKEPKIYERAAYYNAVVGTKHEGNSVKLAVEHIKNFVEKAI
jgi:hypothetical protein